MSHSIFHYLPPIPGRQSLYPGYQLIPAVAAHRFPLAFL